MRKVNGRRTASDGKSSHCLWQGELKTENTWLLITPFVSFSWQLWDSCFFSGFLIEKQTFFEDHPMNISTKFDFNWPRGLKKKIKMWKNYKRRQPIFWVRWAKNHIICVLSYLEDLQYQIKIFIIIELLQKQRVVSYKTFLSVGTG
jgi:hypothetical protein